MVKPQVAENSQPNSAALTERNIRSMICEEIVQLFEWYNFEYEYRATATQLLIRYQNCTSDLTRLSAP